MKDMYFRELFQRASSGDEQAMDKILELFDGMLIKHSTINGRLDEDCKQELIIKLIKCVRGFELSSNSEVYECLVKSLDKIIKE